MSVHTVLDTPTFYALRNKKTQKLMPGFKGRAGGTYVNPDRDAKTPPRLFTTPLAASNALLWWSRGMVRMTGGRSPSFDPFDEGDYEIAKQEPVEGRNADDWEVIPLALYAVTKE